MTTWGDGDALLVKFSTLENQEKKVLKEGIRNNPEIGFLSALTSNSMIVLLLCNRRRRRKEIDKEDRREGCCVKINNRRR